MGGAIPLYLVVGAGAGHNIFAERKHSVCGAKGFLRAEICVFAAKTGGQGARNRVFCWGGRKRQNRPKTIIMECLI
jgi:hypothetical protein